MNQKEELTAVTGTKCENCKGNGWVVWQSPDYADQLQLCDECNSFVSNEDAWERVKFTISYARFTAWYFTDYDNVQNLGYLAMSKLREGNKFTITSQDLLNNCYSIPTHIVNELDGIKYDFDIEPRQIKLIP